jgi:hypothetical protein
LDFVGTQGKADIWISVIFTAGLTLFLLISDGVAASLALNRHCVNSKFAVARPLIPIPNPLLTAGKQLWN